MLIIASFVELGTPFDQLADVVQLVLDVVVLHVLLVAKSIVVVVSRNSKRIVCLILTAL